MNFWNPDRVFPFSADPCNANKGGREDKKVKEQKSEPLLSKENKKTEKDRKRQKKTEKDRKRQKKTEKGQKKDRNGKRK